MKFTTLMLITLMCFVPTRFLPAQDVCQGKTGWWMADRVEGHSTQPPHEIKGKTVKTLGFTFKLKEAAKLLKDKDQEIGVNLYKSPVEKWGVLSLGSGESREPFRDLWLIDFKNKRSIPLNIGTGSFARVAWHSNDLFEIFWGGQGYSMSVIVKIGETLQKVHKNDVLLIDAEKEIYVLGCGPDCSKSKTWTKRYIEIGKLFETAVPPERFEIPEAPEGDLAFDDITHVQLKEGNVIVCRKNEKEEVEKMEFAPKLLKGRTSPL